MMIHFAFQICVNHCCPMMISELSARLKWTEEARLLILEKEPNLLFLDVEMPGISGVELLHQIKDMVTWQMQVVFYTAYEKYMLDAIRESVFDYLLKPYTTKELSLVMDRFLSSEQKSRKFSSITSELLSKMNSCQKFMIGTPTGYKTLLLDEVVFFEYSKSNKYWTVLLSSRLRLHLKRNTSAEAILGFSGRFVQINQQQIINVNHLSMIEGRKCILCPPFEAENNLVISRNYMRGVQDKFLFV
jgi:Response regulator of the LytR/AlgR family